MSTTRDGLGGSYEPDQLTAVGSDPNSSLPDEADAVSRGDAPMDQGEAARAASGDAPTRRLVRLVSTTLGTDLSIELQPGVNRVGRQRAGNHIVLVSPQVSRWHAELEVGPAQVVLRDLGSANGSYVNGERVQERVLVAGDLVAFSDKFTLRVLVELQPETLRLPAAAVEQTHAAAQAARSSELPPPAAARRASPTSPIDPAARRVPTAEHASPEHALPEHALPEHAPPEHASPQHALPEHALPGAGPASAAVLAAHPAAAAESPGVTPQPAPPPAPARPARQTRPLTVAQAGSLVGALATDPAQPIDPLAAGLSVIERDRRQLGLLYQIARGCLLQTSLAELDALLIRALEQSTGFTQAFIGYQLPTRDWKLVVSRGGEHWDPELLRRLLQRGLQARQLVLIDDSLRDPTLGQRADGQPDQRALLPLWAPREPLGAACIVTPPAAPDGERAAYLTLFAELAALALRHALRRERSEGAGT